MHPMQTMSTLACSIWLLAGALPLSASAGQSAPGPAEFVWDAAAAEHLFNRAGFGARPDFLVQAVSMGHAACVERLLDGGFGAQVDPFATTPPPHPGREALQALDEMERRSTLERVRRHEREQLAGFAGWWIDQMIEGNDPLRERMTLFWHGYFTSSYQDVKSSLAMIGQNELLRRNALGNFGELLRGIIRDPAMLEYLDNNQNRKASPNENFARELMELFTLGEGNYGEDDVKEAARALTGWVRRPPGPDGLAQAVFRPGQHDNGKKTVLGVTGKLGADDLVKILLDQPACSRWLARKLLVYFEGRDPSAERLAAYERCLRENGYELKPLLHKLFLDPQFYAPEVRLARISGPIDYLVGTCRRLAVRPPGQLVWLAAGQIGQRLFDPPNVKGWDGGKAWITTSTLLTRGNLSGMLLGVVRWEDVMAEEVEPEEDPSAMSMSGSEMAGEEDMTESAPKRPAENGSSGPAKGEPARRRAGNLGEMGRFARYLGDGYRPNVNLSARCERAGMEGDESIVRFLADDLLAVPLTDAGRATLIQFLAQEGTPQQTGEDSSLQRASSKELRLRKLAHLILSLPEAQLN